MAVDRFSKRAAESRPFGFDFAGDLSTDPTETIVSAVFVVTLADTGVAVPSMLSGSPVVGGTTCMHRLVGGTPGTLYKVKATATTSTANVLEAVAPLKVEA